MRLDGSLQNEGPELEGNAGTLGHEPKGERVWRVGTLQYTAAGLAILFFWLLWGDFTWSMKERAASPIVQLLLKKFHASDAVMALFLATLPSMVGMLLGPVISYRSDRHRSRVGRRIPYLLVITPVAALGMIGLAMSPAMGRYTGQVLRLGAAQTDKVILGYLGLSWIIFEAATVAANGLFVALVNDVVPVGLLGRFFGLFRAVSLLVGIGFQYWLLGAAETYYRAIFIGIGVLYGVGFMAMCLRVKEGEYPPAPVDVEKGSRLVRSIREYARDCFSKPYYLWIFAGITLANFAFQPVNLYSQPYAQSIHLSMKDYGHCGALTYAISLTMAYFLGALVDRFHPLRAGILSLILYALITLWGGLYISNINTFRVAYVLHGVLSGTFFTVSASLGQRLFPRVTFAQFASAYGIVWSVTNMCMCPLIGVFLDRSGHNYRYTFLMSSVVAFLGVAVLCEVYRRFRHFGGVEGYVAP
jgi:maltose/moltooligosaccharide transporter